MKHPFSSGTQYLDWRRRNCDRCKKDYNFETHTENCDLEGAISFAAIDSGEIADNIAKRIGLPGNELSLTWNCPERDDAKPDMGIEP